MIASEDSWDAKMKLKCDKKFQPMEVDAEDELFPNGIFEFNITKLIAYIKANPGSFPIEEVVIDTLGESSGNLNEAVT